MGSGWRRIDEITTDDEVLSRDEHDPSGPLAWKKVEETFERVGLVLELEVGGRTIGTTAEHPFYVLGKGWTAAGELKPGDRIVGLDPRESVAVTALRLTGRQEKLYNLRVADYHTYFVGGSTWGFALWAHNNNPCTAASACAGKTRSKYPIARRFYFNTMKDAYEAAKRSWKRSRTR